MAQPIPRKREPEGRVPESSETAFISTPLNCAVEIIYMSPMLVMIVTVDLVSQLMFCFLKYSSPYLYRKVD